MLRILRTTSFRFTLIFVLLFSVTVAGMGAYFYTATFGEAARQTDALINLELEQLTDVFSDAGPGTLTRVLRQRSAWTDDSIYMLISAPSGAVLAGDLNGLPEEALAASGGFFDFTFERPVLNAQGAEVGYQERDARGRMMRIQPAPDSEQSYLVVVARDIASREALRSRSQSIVIRVAIVTIAFGVVIGLLFSRSLLRRVEMVNRTAQAVRRGDLTRRIPQTGADDELDHLGANLNAMLDQIERLMSGMREVSDNIAHDLRSPLTRMRNRLADALKGDHDERDAALRATIVDSERMIATFNALLSIARIRSGEGAGAMQSVDLVAIVEEMGELYEPAAQDAGFVLSVDARPTRPIKGSRELLSQAIANFLDNALKYAKGGTRIELNVRPFASGGAVLEVVDDGPGVNVKDRERILERFVRLEESRTTPGSGLGLSLVDAIARAHNAVLKFEDGLVSAEDVNPNNENQQRGLRVSLTFPPARD